MHLKSCCVLFLLALVACQAAPSSKVLEQTINEAETTFDKNGIQLEEPGAEKERAKKSATTFCVEVRSGKPEQVPCRQEVRPQGLIQESKPLVIVQPIPIPAPAVVDYPKQPIVIQPQPPQPPQLPQPQPPQEINVVHQAQQTANINYPQALQTQPQVVPIQPVPQHVAPVPAPAPAPAPVPIINIVPSAPAPAPCDKPTIVQPPQPQHIHTVHVIHPQPTPRPSVTLIQHEVKPQKEEKLKPMTKLQPVLIPHQELAFVKQKDTYKNCDRPHLESLDFLVQPSPTTFIKTTPQHLPEIYKPQEEAYECSCRSENRVPTLTPYVASRFFKLQKSPVYSDGAFESLPYRSSLISTENNPSGISDQPIFFASEGAREAEGRHHKKQLNPVNLSVQFPIVYPGSDNAPKYYEYRPSYTNPNVYSYPSYGNYGNYGTYGTSYPVSYDSQASSVPAITVNAGGPFYRESQHTDSLSLSNEVETLPREALSTNEIIDAFNNQKRETNIVQLKNEQKEITQNKNIEEAMV